MHSVNHFAMYVGHYASHLKLNTVLNVNYTSINWKEKKISRFCKYFNFKMFILN